MSGATIRVSLVVEGICALLISAAVLVPSRLDAAEPLRLFRSSKGSSPYLQRQKVISDLPLDRLKPEAKDRILKIAKSPTLYRRLPTQAITCEPELFLFLARKPEVMVGIWELMGITEVQTSRTGPFHLVAEDGNGTECEIDLVYGDPSIHLYVADGSYDGTLVAAPIRGRGVFVLRSSYGKGASGQTTVTGTIDCFVQIDNLGADLIARTLSGLIGRSADHNFVETARFMGQVSLASQQNTSAMIDVAHRISQVEMSTRDDFIRIISDVAGRAVAQMRPETMGPDSLGTRTLGTRTMGTKAMGTRAINTSEVTDEHDHFEANLYRDRSVRVPTPTRAR